MGIGAGIFLLVIGLILVLEAIDLPRVRDRRRRRHDHRLDLRDRRCPRPGAGPGGQPAALEDQAHRGAPPALSSPLVAADRSPAVSPAPFPTYQRCSSHR